VTPVEFLAMLVPHIALRYEVRIRTYGALSTTIRKRFGWIQKDDGEGSATDVIRVDEESEFVRVRKRNWARLISKVWKDDPEICPECGSKLEVLSAISSPAQDDVIERILRCRGEWPSGLRAVALRLRDQPSSATTLRAVPALSGRSPLARSRLTPRGSASAHRVGHQSSSRCFQSRGVGFRSGIPGTKIKTRLVTRGTT
jgi:hypothetical protein